MKASDSMVRRVWLALPISASATVVIAIVWWSIAGTPKTWMLACWFAAVFAGMLVPLWLGRLLSDPAVLRYAAPVVAAILFQSFVILILPIKPGWTRVTQLALFAALDCVLGAIQWAVFSRTRAIRRELEDVRGMRDSKWLEQMRLAPAAPSTISACVAQHGPIKRAILETPTTPTLTYALELTHQELLGLWIRFSFLYAAEKLDDEESRVYAKMVRLVEGK